MVKKLYAIFFILIGDAGIYDHEMIGGKVQVISNLTIIVVVTKIRAGFLFESEDLVTYREHHIYLVFLAV